MKPPTGRRAPNGASTIYFGADGCWHGRVTVGTKDDGSPDRRHIQRKGTGDENEPAHREVIAAVRELEHQRDKGRVRKAGQNWTVQTWLIHWLEYIAKPSVRYNAYQAYRYAVNLYLIPSLGKHKLHRVKPEHFEKLYAKMIAEGKAPGYAHQIHRTARTAFGEAVNRDYLSLNPLERAKAPRVEETEIEPYEEEDIQQLISVALTKRNGIRFVLGLAIGLRQGETIGLKWSRLHKPTRTLKIRRQLQRRTWEHGCTDPHKCGTAHHKTKPCKEGCKRHKRTCPPPCPPDCVSHARACPDRHGGGLVEADVKSAAGRRGIVLPNALYRLLLEHEAAQTKEREEAGPAWEDGDWMFAQRNGRPIDPRRDWEAWKELLREAGVREARLHDARHTAATVLLLLGVPERAVMDVMGWSNSAMAKRYQHVTTRLRTSIADQLDDFLWKSNRDEK